jgi:hypothetical protein
VLDRSSKSWSYSPVFNMVISPLPSRIGYFFQIENKSQSQSCRLWMLLYLNQSLIHSDNKVHDILMYDPCNSICRWTKAVANIGKWSSEQSPRRLRVTTWKSESWSGKRKEKYITLQAQTPRRHWNQDKKEGFIRKNAESWLFINVWRWWFAFDFRLQGK